MGRRYIPRNVEHLTGESLDWVNCFFQKQNTSIAVIDQFISINQSINHSDCLPALAFHFIDHHHHDYHWNG
jgi:hypothetical protein